MNNVTEASHMKRPLLLLGLRLGRVKPTPCDTCLINILVILQLIQIIILSIFAFVQFYNRPIIVDPFFARLPNTV